MNRVNESQDHFRGFSQTLKEDNLRKYGDMEGVDLLQFQQIQVERLVDLEDQLRVAIITSPQGAEVYSLFVDFICEKRKNILDARPYFRERQQVFTAEISVALKKRCEKDLYKFHFNWQFVSFVLKCRPWRKNSKIKRLADEIRQVRLELVEMNLPLAISRARIFFSSTPKSHLAHMDLVQIACEGLMSGIDKFCLPFSKVFRGVCIGRITGNFIESYNQTLLHFFPRDKRVIYRANKAASKMSEKWAEMDFDRIATSVNFDVEEDQHKTNGLEIAGLMAASSCVSADESDTADLQKVDGKVPVRGLSRYAASDDWRPDTRLEGAQVHEQLFAVLPKLPLLEQKVLKLRGLSL